MPVRTKDQLKAELNTTFFENPGGGITPALVQTFMIDVIDSIPDATGPNYAFGTGVAGGIGSATATGRALFMAAGAAAGSGSATGISITPPVFTTDFTTLSALPTGFSLSRATTGTYFDASGVLQTAAIDAARFDHDLSTLAAKGLLIEEQRTNLCLSSQSIGGTSWNAFAGASAALNATTAPDGTSTASTITFGTGAADQIYQTGFAVPDGTTVTVSVFDRSGTAHKFRLKVSDTSDRLSADVTTTSAWQKIPFTRTLSGASLGAIALFTDSGNNAGSIDAWGYQLEPNSFATSYIPTTSAAVTRSADIPSSSSPLTGYLAAGPSVWEFQDEATGTIARTAYAAGAFDWPVNKWYRSMGVYPAGTDTSGHMTVGSPY